MINTILLDLDGTLIDVEMDNFKQKYFSLLGKRLSKYMQSELYWRALQEASSEMMNNLHPSETNQSVFWTSFIQKTSCEHATIQSVFDDFCFSDYSLLKDYVHPLKGVIDCLIKAKENGLELVLATNPTFPKDIILQRLLWGGGVKGMFSFISSYENMHFCKPSHLYYNEVLHNIRKEPRECLMIGNDINYDLGGREIGIKTCITDSPLKTIKIVEIVSQAIINKQETACLESFDKL